jgi:hypothetical protein
VKRFQDENFEEFRDLSSRPILLAVSGTNLSVFKPCLEQKHRFRGTIACPANPLHCGLRTNEIQGVIRRRATLASSSSCPLSPFSSSSFPFA